MNYTNDIFILGEKKERMKKFCLKLLPKRMNLQIGLIMKGSFLGHGPLGLPPASSYQHSSWAPAVLGLLFHHQLCSH